mmetsp:Transcript_22772/g.53626  ORF Transcript_22772/g.53626 Transcript_22772/m.53626 type:complete len:256 (-) Transcript_22772:771-1538(-)
MQDPPLLSHVIEHLLDVPHRIVHLIIVCLLAELDFSRTEGLYILAVLWSSTTRQVGGHDLSAARIAFASVLEAPDRGTHPFSKLCCTFVAFRGVEELLKFCLWGLRLPLWVSRILNVTLLEHPLLPEIWRIHSLGLLVIKVREELLENDDSIFVHIEQLEEISGSLHTSDGLPVHTDPSNSVCELLRADITAAIQVQLFEGCTWGAPASFYELTPDGLTMLLPPQSELLRAQLRSPKEAALIRALKGASHPRRVL